MDSAMKAIAVGSWRERLNAGMDGMAGAESAAVRDGVLTAYLPSAATWRDGDFDPAVLKDVRAAVMACRSDLFGLSLEIGSGSIKLLAREWRDGNGVTLANVKLQVPAEHDNEPYVAALDRLIDAFSFGLRRIAPENFDPASPERLFEGLTAPEDFLCVYGTQAVRALRRRLGGQVLDRVRELSGDEEGLIAFASIVPPEWQVRPGVVAAEIGSGSTEIIRTGADGRPRPLTLAIGGRTRDASLAGLEMFLRTGDASPAIATRLESPPEVVADFFADAPATAALFINASRASAGFRVFARERDREGGEAIAIDAGLVANYRERHGTDGYAAKAGILLAVARGIGVDGFREGRRGGLKMGVSALIGKGLQRFGDWREAK